MGRETFRGEARGCGGISAQKVKREGQELRRRLSHVLPEDPGLSDEPGVWSGAADLQCGGHVRHVSALVYIVSS